MGHDEWERIDYRKSLRCSLKGAWKLGALKTGLNEVITRRFGRSLYYIEAYGIAEREREWEHGVLVGFIL